MKCKEGIPMVPEASLPPQKVAWALCQGPPEKAPGILPLTAVKKQSRVAMQRNPLCAILFFPLLLSPRTLELTELISQLLFFYRKARKIERERERARDELRIGGRRSGLGRIGKREEGGLLKSSLGCGAEMKMGVVSITCPETCN